MYIYFYISYTFLYKSKSKFKLLKKIKMYILLYINKINFNICFILIYSCFYFIYFILNNLTKKKKNFFLIRDMYRYLHVEYT